MGRGDDAEGGPSDDGEPEVEQKEVPDSVFGGLNKMESFTGRANRKKK